MIVVRDRKCGNIIVTVNSYEEGEEVLTRFEASNKAEGTYEEDFYEIAVIGLREARKWRGMSQAELSKASGISVRTIQAYEQGARKLSGASYDHLKMLSDALRVTIEDLVKDA